VCSSDLPIAPAVPVTPPEAEAAGSNEEA